MDKIAYPRIKEDKAKVAELFGVSIYELREFTPSFRPGLSTIAIYCRHQMDMETMRCIPNYTVIPAILLDENGVCYGLAAACLCQKVYYIKPTIELLQLADSLGGSNRKQLDD